MRVIRSIDAEHVSENGGRKRMSSKKTGVMLDFVLVAMAVLLCISYCTSARAGIDCQHGADFFKCVTYIRAYDGDTITFKIPNVHPLLGEKAGVRVSGIDTPEIRGKTDCEKEAAKKARGLVRGWMSEATMIELNKCIRGKYFRIVCDVEFDGRDVADELIKLDLAYRYDGGTKTETDWCLPLKDEQFSIE